MVDALQAAAHQVEAPTTLVLTPTPATHHTPVLDRATHHTLVEDAHQVDAVQAPATQHHSLCMEGVDLTTQAGPQVAAVASTQDIQLAGASRPFPEASQTLPLCTGHVVHQLVEDVGPAVEVNGVPHTLYQCLPMEDVDLAVLPMELWWEA